jgi:hypothetical protein
MFNKLSHEQAGRAAFVPGRAPRELPGPPGALAHALPEQLLTVLKADLQR